MVICKRKIVETHINGDICHRKILNWGIIALLLRDKQRHRERELQTAMEVKSYICVKNMQAPKLGN